jgi:hypothetical protein
LAPELEFVPAEALKGNYAVFGHFYNLSIEGRQFACRSGLEIIKKSTCDFIQSEPDAVFVMMNPGSSKPNDPNYEWPDFSAKDLASLAEDKHYSLVKPDPTQYQLMRLMRIEQWRHVRVINLSDLIEGNSGRFVKIFTRCLKIDPSNPTSILHNSRQRELKKAIGNRHPPLVIAAWGKKYALKKSAFLFLEMFPNLRGIPREAPWYAHASPTLKTEKIKWLKKMSKSFDEA